jgi:pimeloyl-ACP methyl ester carboxylesterase
MSSVTTTPEKIVHANGVDLCAQTFGPPDAEPVLLIAGAASTMLYWDEEFCARLAAGPRFVLRYDHRDTGRSVTSPPGAPNYTSVDLLGDAIGLLDALGIDRAHLVGLSMGGGLAQLAAISHPARVASLTLIATSPAGPGAGSDLPSMSDEVQAEFAAVPEPDWADREAVIEYLVEQERLCAARSVPFDTAGMRTRMADVVDRSPEIRAMFNHFVVVGGDAPRHRLADIAAPTLVLHGDEDPVCPAAHGVALAAEIPGARLVTLPGVGHEWPRRAWEPAVPAILAHTGRG